MALNSTGELVTHLQSAVLDNPGGIGLHVESASPSSQINVDWTQFDLHGTSIKLDSPLGLTSNNSSFTNSEVHVDGVDGTTQLALCASNVFQPALRIAGCMDPAAANFTECATVNFGCEYPGCTSPKACTMTPPPMWTTGARFDSCAGCPLGFACNYDPVASLYRVESCLFTNCGEGMAEPNAERSVLTSSRGAPFPRPAITTRRRRRRWQLYV